MMAADIEVHAGTKDFIEVCFGISTHDHTERFRALRCLELHVHTKILARIDTGYNVRMVLFGHLFNAMNEQQKYVMDLLVYSLLDIVSKLVVDGVVRTVTLHCIRVQSDARHLMSSLSLCNVLVLMNDIILELSYLLNVRNNRDFMLILRICVIYHRLFRIERICYINSCYCYFGSIFLTNRESLSSH